MKTIHSMRLGALASVAGLAATLMGCSGEPIDPPGDPADDALADGPTDRTEEALSLGANLLANGFFESAIYPWNDVAPAHSVFGHWHGGAWQNEGRMGYQLSPDAGAVRRTAAAAWGGTYGVRTTANGPDTDVAVGTYAAQRITAGARYRIWLMNRRRAGAGQCVLLSFVSDDYGRLDDLEYRVGTDTAWHVFTRTITAPQYADRVYVGLGTCGRSSVASSYDWDSVSLRKLL
ncbi:hypothetical protein BH11MYX4_BH11MYX4_50800 [soil metagenome]